MYYIHTYLNFKHFMFPYNLNTTLTYCNPRCKLVTLVNLTTYYMLLCYFMLCYV